FSTDVRVNGRDISRVTLSASKLTHRPAGECPCCGEPLYRCVVCSADYCPVCAEVDCATGDSVKHLCICHDEEEGCYTTPSSRSSRSRSSCCSPSQPPSCSRSCSWSVGGCGSLSELRRRDDHAAYHHRNFTRAEHRVQRESSPVELTGNRVTERGTNIHFEARRATHVQHHRRSPRTRRSRASVP